MKIVTVCSLVLATNYLRATGHDTTLHVQTGPYTHWNREHLVEDAQAADASHLMFIDTDIVFETDAITRLLERDLDVVGGAYNMKQDRPVSTIKMWNADRSGFVDQPEREMPEAPFQVAAMGTGFMLINMRVFDRLPRPWFPCEYGDGNGTAPMGEDIRFCLNAQDAGFRVWCDPTVALQHIGDKRY